MFKSGVNCSRGPREKGSRDAGWSARTSARLEATSNIVVNWKANVSDGAKL